MNDRNVTYLMFVGVDHIEPVEHHHGLNEIAAKIAMPIGNE